MFASLIQTDAMQLVVEMLLNSILPGLGLLAIVIVGLRFAKKINAATQYALGFSVLVGILAIAFVVPIASTIELDLNSLMSGDSAEHGAIESFDIEDSGFPQPLASDLPIVDENESFAPVPLGAEKPGVQAPVQELDGDLSLRASATENVAEIQPIAGPLATDESKPPLFAIPSTLKIPSAWVPYLLGIWILGVAALFLRLSISYAYLAIAKRRSRPLDPKRASALCKVAESIDLKRQVQILVSNELSVPLVAGFTKPAILIPAALCDHLSEKELEQVVLHELAHLKRYDDWGKLIQQLMQIPLFFHPAVMWIGRKLDFAREVACDDWIIDNARVSRNTYSTSLFKVAEWSLNKRRAFAGVGMAASRSQLERRIKMLMDKNRQVWSGVKLGKLFGMFALLAVGAVFLLNIMPNVGVSEPMAEVAVDESNEPLQVMYKHRYYQPAMIGIELSVSGFLVLNVPSESLRWWESIEEIQFPEAPHMEIELREIYRHPDYDQPDDFLWPIQIAIAFGTDESGAFEVSRLHARDQEGVLWEVPLGLISFDIRDGSILNRIGPEPISCPAAYGGDPKTIRSESDSLFYYSRNVYQNELDVPIELLGVEWGEHLFAEFKETRLSLNEAEPATSLGRFDLAQRDAIDLPHEVPTQAFFSSEKLVRDDEAHEALRSSDILTYRVLEGEFAGSVVEQAMLFCGFSSNADTNTDTFGAVRIEETSVQSHRTDETQPLPVLYKHHVYTPMNAGLEGYLLLGAPHDSQDWWDNINEFTFPEAPEVEVVSVHSIGPSASPVGEIRPGIQVEPYPLLVSLIVKAETVGIHEISKLNVLDNSGITWEVPLGSVQFDVRDGSVISNAGKVFERCNPASFAFPTTAGFGLSRYADYPNRNESAVELLGIEWGESFFSDLKSSQHLFGREGESPIELPVGLTPPLEEIETPYELAPGDELAVHLEIYDDEIRAIINSFDVIQYRILEGDYKDEIVQEAVPCGGPFLPRDYEAYKPSPIETPLQPLLQNQEPLQVMYKHLMYQGLNTGIERDFGFLIPSESREYWDNISSVSFPEAPEISITEIENSFYSQGTNEDLRGYAFRLELLATTEGQYTVTKLQAANQEGFTYEIQLGEIQFDVRDGNFIVQQGAMFGDCSSLNLSHPVDANRWPYNFSFNYSHRKIGGSPVEIVEILWGQELYAELDEAFIDTKLQDEPDGPIKEFELPQELSVDSTLFTRARLLDDDIGAILWANQVIGYRILEEDLKDRIIYEVIAPCVQLVGPFNAGYDTFSARIISSPTESEDSSFDVKSKENVEEADTSNIEFAAVQSQIVFQCHLAGGATDICIANADGSNLRVLIEAEKREYGFRLEKPSINAAGQVAFTCLEDGATDLCVIDGENSPVSKLVDTRSPLIKLKFDSPSMNSEGLIAFECSDQNLGGDICLGSMGNLDYEVIVNDVNGPADPNYKRPRINNLGQVVFSCTDGHGGSDVCAVEQSGLNFRVLVDDTNGSNEAPAYFDPSISDAGEVSFTCLDEAGGSNICLLDPESNELSILVEDANGDLHPNYSEPSMNDLGQIVFKCSDEDDGWDLCTSTEGSGEVELIVDDTNGIIIPRYSNPVINNAGRIVFECPDSVQGGDICQVNFDGSDFAVVQDDFNGQNVPGFSFPSVNDADQVIFVCITPSGPGIVSTGNQRGLCSLGSNFREYEVLLSPPGDTSRIFYTDPDMNDRGEIVFSCITEEGDNDLCVINFDGTGLRVLIDDEPGDNVSIFPMISPSISNNGQLVFECIVETERGDRSTPCLSDLVGGPIVDILPESFFLSYALPANPSINSAGQIVFSCNSAPWYEERLPAVCTVNADGTGFGVAAELEFGSVLIDEGRNLFSLYPTRPSINDQGVIVFTCADEDEGQDICAVNVDGSDLRIVIDDTNGTELPNYSFPSIN